MAFPAALVMYSLTNGAPTMGVCARILASVLMAAITLKLNVEGLATLPKYSKERGLTTLGGRHSVCFFACSLSLETSP